MWYGYFCLSVYISGVLKKTHLILFKPIFLSLLLIITTFYLGIWQLQRLEWKNNLISNFDSLKDSNPVEISNIKIKEFVKIKIHGSINRNKKIFFPAKTYNGNVGLRIATEFTADDGKIYLLDEGWFPNLKYEYFKKNNDIFNEDVIGYIRYPRKPKIFTPENNLEANEWYTYDLKLIGKFLSSPINQVFFIKKMTSNKENFLYSSSHEYQFRNNHLQYAITWFCMSLAFFVMFIVYLKKNNK